MTTLYVLNDGEFTVANADDVLACAHEWIAYNYRAGELVLADYPKTEAFLKLHVGLKDYEVFGLLHLTTQHQLIAMEDLFRGTLDGGAVDAREVVRSALHIGSGPGRVVSQPSVRRLEPECERHRGDKQDGGGAETHRCRDPRPPHCRRSALLVPTRAPALTQLTARGRHTAVPGRCSPALTAAHPRRAARPRQAQFAPSPAAGTAHPQSHDRPLALPRVNQRRQIQKPMPPAGPTEHAQAIAVLMQYPQGVEFDDLD